MSRPIRGPNQAAQGVSLCYACAADLPELPCFAAVLELGERQQIHRDCRGSSTDQRANPDTTRNESEIMIQPNDYGANPSVAPQMGLDTGRATMPVDMVNHPPHYRSKDGTMTVMEVIEAFGLEDDHYLANVLKYVLRHRAKGGEQDLAKAAWYLNRRVARPRVGPSGQHSV